MFESPSRFVTYGSAVVVFVLDRISKYLIDQHVSSSDTYSVVPGFFDIIHTKNRGAAFSLLAGAESEWRTFFLVGVSAAALVLIASLLWRPAGRLGGTPLTRFGLALILGGALGNLYDRMMFGAVIDFLELYVGSFHWPAFNVADSAITVGVGMILLDLVRSRRPAHRT